MDKVARTTGKCTTTVKQTANESRYADLRELAREKCPAWAMKLNLCGITIGKFWLEQATQVVQRFSSRVLSVTVDNYLWSCFTTSNTYMYEIYMILAPAAV